MGVEMLSERAHVARKHHRCNDCGGWIVPGDTYRNTRLVYDGSAYTWKQHRDCFAMNSEITMAGFWGDYEDGVPPLYEQEDVLENLNYWRGHYPHVVCRIEFRQQIAEIRRAERLAEWELR